MKNMQQKAKTNTLRALQIQKQIKNTQTLKTNANEFTAYLKTSRISRLASLSLGSKKLLSGLQSCGK